MTVGKLVSLRLSSEEYDVLKQICPAAGFRSVSGFCREAVLRGIEMRRGARAFLGDDLATVSLRLEELDSALKSLSGVIARVLGSREEKNPSSTKEAYAAVQHHEAIRGFVHERLFRQNRRR
jgi:hypothetical protein